MQRKRRKGKDAERVDQPDDSCLGHTVKSRMTVIRSADGALSMRICYDCRNPQPALCAPAVFDFRRGCDSFEDCKQWQLPPRRHIMNIMMSGSKGSKLSCACTNEILTLGPAQT